jgi:hypothetical protein
VRVLSDGEKANIRIPSPVLERFKYKPDFIKSSATKEISARVPQMIGVMRKKNCADCKHNSETFK